MITKNRINAFVELGNFINQNTEELQEVIAKAYLYNSWFTPENTKRAFQNIAHEFLSKEKLERWLGKYALTDEPGKTVAVVAAGNIPMVAFHDLLCVLISGNKLLLKLSDKDKFLLPFILDKLIEMEPEFKENILLKDRLENFDAIIATGSNNSAKHFEYYFGKYKNIIRRNRNAVAVFNGEESPEDLQRLGSDVFDYFGLGCRNVSKIFVPSGFDLMKLKEGFKSYEWIMQHNQYMNNLDYQRTLYLMNQTPMVNIDFINVVENKSLHSPVSCLHYEYYDSLEEVKDFLKKEKENIQCVVGNAAIENILAYGSSQQPGLSDYADNVDTLQFILSL